MLNDALSQLDDVLTNRNIYIEARQQRIDSLKSLWRESPENAMYLNGLVEEYTSFNTDSAGCFVFGKLAYQIFAVLALSL